MIFCQVLRIAHAICHGHELDATSKGKDMIHIKIHKAAVAKANITLCHNNWVPHLINQVRLYSLHWKCHEHSRALTAAQNAVPDKIVVCQVSFDSSLTQTQWSVQTPATSTRQWSCSFHVGNEESWQNGPANAQICQFNELVHACVCVMRSEWTWHCIFDRSRKDVYYSLLQLKKVGWGRCRKESSPQAFRWFNTMLWAKQAGQCASCVLVFLTMVAVNTDSIQFSNIFVITGKEASWIEPIQARTGCWLGLFDEAADAESFLSVRHFRHWSASDKTFGFFVMLSQTLLEVFWSM